MNTKLKTGVTLCALALGLSSILRPVHAADEDSRLTTGSADGSVAADPAALRQWHEDMRQIATPGDGCFHASYPNTFGREWRARPTSRALIPYIAIPRTARRKWWATEMTGSPRLRA